jgi:hypothetical protein
LGVREFGSLETQGTRTQHVKPHRVVRDDPRDAREGPAGRLGVAERPAVPRKPSNVDGGKGPQFNTTQHVGKDGRWGNLSTALVFRDCRRRYMRRRDVVSERRMREDPPVLFDERDVETELWFVY